MANDSGQRRRNIRLALLLLVVVLGVYGAFFLSMSVR